MTIMRERNDKDEKNPPGLLPLGKKHFGEPGAKPHRSSGFQLLSRA
jgi:hypothetical protein